MKLLKNKKQVKNEKLLTINPYTMKKLLFTLIFVSIIFSCTSECVIPEELENNEVDTTMNSLSLQKLIDSLNGVGTIDITEEITIDANLTIPSGIVLNVKENGRFKINVATILTIEGKVIANLQTIFNDVVTFKNGSVEIVNSEWFGTDANAVTRALLSSDSIPVKITNDLEVVNSILIGSNQTLIMYDATIFPKAPMQGGAVIRNRSADNKNITILGGTIDGTAESTVAYDAILFNNVDSSLIKDVTCINVHITASTDTGNIHLIDCTYTTIENCDVKDTWKMGIKIDFGNNNTILGGYFNGTHDSGIGAISTPHLLIDGAYVDNCGTSNASNIATNLQYGVVKNCIIINGTGTTNGNGITLGHEGYPALDCVFENNLVANNNSKGVFVQGSTCDKVKIRNNIILENGLGTNHLSSAGIAVYYAVNNTLIENNEIIGNKRGIELRQTSLNTSIINNRMTNNILENVLDAGINTIIENNNEITDLSYLFDLPLTDLQLSVLATFIN